MTLYRIVLAPEAPLASPLQSDTLFGAFCWSWLRCFGQEALESEIIKPALSGDPPLIFSNGFPHGALPLPNGCQDLDNQLNTIQDKEKRRKAYQKEKKLKSAQYVSISSFNRICQGDWHGFTEALMSDGGESVTTLHNMVSRSSGTVEAIDDVGSLYGLDRQFFSNRQQFDCYLLTSLKKERLESVLGLMFALGIGADKSTGCGVFQIVSFVPTPELLEPPEGANAIVALSNFLPAQADPHDGWYQVLPKFPKLDRELAAGDYPFKKPLFFIKSGSLFKSNQIRTWYGRCVTGIAAVDIPVTVNGCTIALPLKLPEAMSFTGLGNSSIS